MQNTLPARLSMQENDTNNAAGANGTITHLFYYDEMTTKINYSTNVLK
jgi:hypothetical protein